MYQRDLKTEYLPALRSCALFAGMQDDEITGLLGCFSPRVSRHRRGEILFLSGDSYKGVGVVLRGKVQVVKESAAGARTLLLQKGEGSVFGEMAAFSSSKSWPSTVIAQTDCAVMLIDRCKITGRCSNNCVFHRRFLENFICIISERGLHLNKKLEYMSVKSVEGKIGAFLLDACSRNRSNNFDIGMNRNELADFLCVSRPTLSRELARLKKNGVIDYHLSAFHVLDPEKLKLKLMK